MLNKENILELQKKIEQEKKELENFLDKWIPYSIGYFLIILFLIIYSKNKQPWLIFFYVLITAFILLMCLYFYKKKKKDIAKLEKELVARLKKGLKEE